MEAGLDTVHENVASLGAGQEAWSKELAEFKDDVLAKLGSIAAFLTTCDSQVSSHGISMGRAGGLKVPSLSKAGFSLGAEATMLFSQM